MRIRILAPLVIALCIVFTGCSSNKTVLPYFRDIAEVESGTLPNMEYMPVLQADDELFISVSSAEPAATAIFNVPEVNTATRNSLAISTTPRLLTYIVDTEGNIEFPQLGKVHVAGMNVEQLQQKLTTEISRWVNDPVVTVRMMNFTVVVAGEVKQPQTIRVDRNRFTILEALSAAGDLIEYGERSNILLIRENDGNREFVHINLNESDILNSQYYYLQPNDYIYVSPNNVRQENSKYNQNNGFKLSIISTVVSAASVIASLVIALTVK